MFKLKAYIYKGLVSILYTGRCFRYLEGRRVLIHGCHLYLSPKLVCLIYCNYIRIFQYIVNILYNAVFFHETPILIGWRQIFAGINSTIDAVKMFAHPQTIHHVKLKVQLNAFL